MALSKNEQRLLPANRARIEVRAMDGSQLASTTPQAARRLVNKRAALFRRDESGRLWLEMTTPCGSALPPLIVPPGTVMPTKA